MKKETKSTEKTIKTAKTAKTSKYQELNDSELEVVCGGNEAFCSNTSIDKFFDVFAIK